MPLLLREENIKRRVLLTKKQEDYYSAFELTFYKKHICLFAGSWQKYSYTVRRKSGALKIYTKANKLKEKKIKIGRAHV